jgi:hypothetical protein
LQRLEQPILLRPNTPRELIHAPAGINAGPIAAPLAKDVHELFCWYPLVIAAFQ